MNELAYRHSRAGVAGLTLLNAESEIAAERASLEAQGNIVTNISRPVGSAPAAPQFVVET